MLANLNNKKEEIKEIPLLQKPFGFYSSFIKLTSRDKENIMEREIIEFYKS